MKLVPTNQETPAVLEFSINPRILNRYVSQYVRKLEWAITITAGTCACVNCMPGAPGLVWIRWAGLSESFH